MATQNPVDPIGWAKKPRSQKALELLLTLVRERDSVFVEIYDGLVRSGKVVGENLIYKWNHASNQWTKT